MSYRPDESVLMAYFYGELEGTEKEKVEQYLLQVPEARVELEKLQELRVMLGAIKDKEVIAPPVFIAQERHRIFWNSPYFKKIVAIAAALLLVMVVGKITGLQINYAGHELRIAFGQEKVTPPIPESVTPEQVQHMINNSLTQNNESMRTNWQQTQQELDASIRYNLASNSAKIDNLVRTAAMASQDQIRNYVTDMQAQNAQTVKDYFQLTASEQKLYIEDLLVDFAKYLQEQRNEDINLLQSRLTNIEQNTDEFKQETEQILTSIITNTTLNEKKY